MGVSFLLDTHVFLWLLGEPDNVPEAILAELGDVQNRLLVSAVSAMEVSTKVRLGKLEAARHVVPTWSRRVADIGGEELSLTSAHAVLAGSLTWAHRDPFDRLLVGQAISDNLTLVSSDTAIATLLGVAVVSW